MTHRVPAQKRYIVPGRMYVQYVLVVHMYIHSVGSFVVCMCVYVRQPSATAQWASRHSHKSHVALLLRISFPYRAKSLRRPYAYTYIQ